MLSVECSTFRPLAMLFDGNAKEVIEDGAPIA